MASSFIMPHYILVFGIIRLVMTRIQLEQHIKAAVVKALGGELDLGRLVVSVPADPEHGDFATNAAMVYAKVLGKPPLELAGKLAAAIKSGSPQIARAEVAGPGFINITLDDAAVLESAEAAAKFKPGGFAGQKVVSEYSDPNPFKVLHVGHLYTTVVGDAVSNLVRAAGGEAHPVNFGGDVGLHVAKTMWAILKELGGEHPAKLDKVPAKSRPEWMAACYVAGEQAYAEDATAKTAIEKLNAAIYEIHAHDDHASGLAKVYWTCREWSYAYFKDFYASIGSGFERYYPESEAAPIGLATVRAQLKRGVYKESDGAVVFEGEPYGLHTRVFITSQGLPTYEAKDVGVIQAKWRDYHFDRSIVITSSEITDYMKVVLKSLELFEPELVKRTIHITHGNVKLAGGVKMSSRKGNILQAMDVIELTAEANREASGKDDMAVVLAAVKYSFLKHRIGSDIVFIPDESVSLDGNSGPYIQYAHARARSILAKSHGKVTGGLGGGSLEAGERVLTSKLAEFSDVVQRSVDELRPHHICTYLYELAQTFNRFYETNRVLGDKREDLRLGLVETYAGVLRGGLEVLGIDAPDRL